MTLNIEISIIRTLNYPNVILNVKSHKTIDFLQNQVINKNTCVIFRIVSIIILQYSG